MPICWMRRTCSPEIMSPLPRLTQEQLPTVPQPSTSQSASLCHVRSPVPSPTDDSWSKEAEQQVRDNWNADLLDEKDMLARDNVAFATFDTGTTPHGASAQHIAECLALRCAVPGAKPHS